MVIGEKGVKMDMTKVEAIMSWLMLKHVKDIQAFLGFANFYHWFIQDFSKIATPLHNLMCKETVWRWGGVSTEGIWWIEEEICWRTNFGSCQLHVPLTHGVRHFRLCNRSCIIYATWGWEVAPVCISIQKSKWCQKKLWCAW